MNHHFCITTHCVCDITVKLLISGGKVKNCLVGCVVIMLIVVVVVVVIDAINCIFCFIWGIF